LKLVSGHTVGYEPLNYKRSEYTKGPRGFIIYPGKENLKITTEEDVIARVKTDNNQ
jgi:hypothetical protein